MLTFSSVLFSYFPLVMIWELRGVLAMFSLLRVDIFSCAIQLLSFNNDMGVKGCFSHV